MHLTRRRFLAAGAGTVGALAFGPAFWRSALAADGVTVGPNPYGELGPPDANGLRLPPGFTAREVARANQPVPGTAYRWHVFPDGGATFPMPDGGWVLVSTRSRCRPTRAPRRSASARTARSPAPTASSAARRPTAPAGQRRGGRGCRARSTTAGTCGSATRRAPAWA